MVFSMVKNGWERGAIDEESAGREGRSTRSFLEAMVVLGHNMSLRVDLNPSKTKSIKS